MSEQNPSINRWDYMKIKFLYMKGNNQQITQTPTEWERICTSDTLDRDSYSEFSKNYRN